MENALLADKTLEDFIQGLNLTEDKKAMLIKQIPFLDERERVDFLKALIDIYYLERNKQQAQKDMAAVRQDIADKSR